MYKSLFVLFRLRSQKATASPLGKPDLAARQPNTDQINLWLFYTAKGGIKMSNTERD